MNLDRVIELAEKAKKLKAELEAVQAEIAAEAHTSATRVTTGYVQVSQPMSDTSNIADRVRRYLKAHSGRTVKASELGTVIPGVDGKYIRNTLARLARNPDNGISSVARGEYQYVGDSMS